MSDRHAFRAQWHDYNGGIYFVTICAHNKRHIFGKIVDNNCGRMVGAQYIAPTAALYPSAPTNSNIIFQPSSLGCIVDKSINEIPKHHYNCEVWNYVIMPNHIHLVLHIKTLVGTQFIAPHTQIVSLENEKIRGVNLGCLKPQKHGDTVDDYHFNSALAVVIRTFKAAVTRTARAQCIAPLPVWQRNFHEHIIRNQRAFDNIMSYIDNNIDNWRKDCFYN